MGIAQTMKIGLWKGIISLIYKGHLESCVNPQRLPCKANTPQ